jgi:hypothetical protein
MAEPHRPKFASYELEEMRRLHREVVILHREVTLMLGERLLRLEERERAVEADSMLLTRPAAGRA